MFAPREQRVRDLDALMRRRDAVPAQQLSDAIPAVLGLRFPHSVILDHNLDCV
jgi:hypothetical protein